MILSYDRDRGRISLSTKKLEPSPGDMLHNPKLVFEKVFLLHFTLLTIMICIAFIFRVYSYCTSQFQSSFSLSLQVNP